MSDNKQYYYKFSAEKEGKNEDGTTKVETHHFAILKPNRRLREDGELFYASETSRYAKAGVLPKAAWNTILSNGGGSISDDDRTRYGKSLIDFRNKSFELNSIFIKSNGERSTEEAARVDELTVELENIRKEIQEFESSQINIFENTAEAKARNRSILWWVTTLAHKSEGGKFVPFFDGASFDDKLDQYDDIEQSEDQEFTLSVLRRITYLVTLWYLGSITTPADFEKFDASLSTDRLKEVGEGSVEEVETEEAPAAITIE